MGVEVAPIDEVIKEQFGLPSTDGALVNSVVPGAPAAKAGIQRGDVIMSFDGKSITTVQSLQDTVTSTPPGRTVPVKVSRGRQALTLSLKTEKLSNKSDDAEDDGEGDDDRSKKQNADGTVEWLGATFATLTPRLANKYEINDSNTTGVVAVDIPEKSIAADAGLNEGDVIRAVNRIPIASANGLAKAKRDVDPKKGVVLDVVREGHSFYLSYKSLQ
jgi:serine protease Do